MIGNEAGSAEDQPTAQRAALTAAASRARCPVPGRPMRANRAHRRPRLAGVRGPGGGLPIAASFSGRTKYNRARRNSENPCARCRRFGGVGTLIGLQIPSRQQRRAEDRITAAQRLRHTLSHAAIACAPTPFTAFKTANMVRAEVPKGKKAWSGAFAIRASGSFRVGNGDGINHKDCKLLHRADGYGFARRPAFPPPAETGVSSARGSDE
jgi:hypothetical protein